MLHNGAVERLEIPGEPDEFIEFRFIRRKDLRKAAETLEARGVASMRAMGAELVVALRPDPEEGERQRQQRAAALADDPVLGYDVDELLRAGVAGWSYAREGKAIRVTPEALDELDEETATWAARQILRLVGIVPAAEAEAARKNA